MCKRAGILAAVLAACLLAGAPVAKAGENDDALLTRVKEQASKGQDSQTATAVSQYVDDHQNIISAILRQYLNYLKQFQAVAGNDATGTPGPPATSGTAGMAQNSGGNAEAQAGVLQTSASPASPQESGSAQTASVQPSGGVQASSGLQTSSVQPSSGLQTSGGLQTAHLAGYPSLPEGEPVSSVKQMSAEQMDYTVKVQKENQARKQYLMQHPEGYSY